MSGFDDTAYRVSSSNADYVKNREYYSTSSEYEYRSSSSQVKPSPQPPTLPATLPPVDTEIKESVVQKKQPIVVQTHVVQQPRKILVDRAAQTTIEVYNDGSLPLNIMVEGPVQSGTFFKQSICFFFSALSV